MTAGAGTAVLAQPLELVRDDGVVLPALQLVPDFDAAERCAGAGVVVVTGGPPRAALEEALVRPLAEHGFFVVALALGGERDHAEDALAAALIGLRQLARGRLGVIAVDGAGDVALAAAACLPTLDAVVHAGGPLPAAGPRLRRARAAVLFLRPEDEASDALAPLLAALAPAHVPVLVRRHPGTSGVFDADVDAAGRAHAPIAWAQLRDFFTTALT